MVVLEHCGRDVEQLHSGRQRCEPHDRCGGHGAQCGRISERELGGDFFRADADAGEHRSAHDQWDRGGRDTLTASPGSWANCGSGACTFAYQWKDCNSSGANCTAISGATSASYPLASSDVGSTIDVVVTASNGGGSASVSSAATSVVVGGGGALPSGVTLQVIDGGSNYYCSHGFTEACSGGWDSRSFFPIGPFWENYAGEQSTWTTLGWNTEFYTTSQTDVNALASDGRFSIPAATVTPNANTVGFDAYDEPPTWSTATGPLTSTSNANQDGRFWYVNNTFNMMQYDQPANSAPGGTQSSFFSDMVSTPNGTTRHFDIGSIDLYWFANGTTGYPYNSLLDGGYLYNLSGNMPQSEAMCGCRYGDMLRDVFGTSVGLPSGKSEAPGRRHTLRRSSSMSRPAMRSLAAARLRR